MTKTFEPIMVFFIGLSGSGKDEQAGRLQAALEARDGEKSALYIYTGEILRTLVKTGSFVGQWVGENVMKTGAKAPDSLAVWAWQQALNEKFTGREHLLFSSSPRTVLEAQVFDDFAKAFGFARVYPIFLDVDRTVAFQRLMDRKRADDTPETINSRLDYFEVQVRPALDYFRGKSKHRLIVIDGNPTDRQKIHQDILKALNLA